MLRLLIADTADALATAVEKQLKNNFEIRVCRDGNRAMKLISSFVPDIIVLDLMLPELDGMSVLYNLRASGKKTKVIVLSRHYNPCDLAKLEKLGVNYILRKPCALSTLLINILELSREQHENAYILTPEEEAENILLQLSFRLDLSRCKCVYYAILERLRNEDCFVTKELYPNVAKICGGTSGRVEKAIRDAIKDAWENGNKAIWQIYFPSGQCPSNECFVGTMAVRLRRLCGRKYILDKAQ